MNEQAYCDAFICNNSLLQNTSRNAVRCTVALESFTRCATIQAFAHLVRELQNRNHSTHPLVIAGGGNGHGADSMLELIESEIEFLKARGLLHFVGKVTDDEQSWLSANCQSFAYSSLYEGFGTPLIEAMKACKPILTSNYSAVAEVFGFT